MKKTIYLSLIIISIINISNSFCQIKSIYDSKYNIFNIGFKITITPNLKTKIIVHNEDSTISETLFDSTLSDIEDIIFIFQNSFDMEKLNYPNNKVIPIPIDKIGIYIISVTYKQKFLLIK